MPNGKKNGKTAKKRRRYGSFAWTDKKTGHLYARVRVTQGDGTTRTVLKRAMNVTHASQLADEIKAQYAVRGDAFLDGEQMTFQMLADWYKGQFAVEPIYVEDVKVGGMRTWALERAKIDRICKTLGPVLINRIDEDMLSRFRLGRLKKVGIATANRDMETIRRMLKKAKAKKWLRSAIDFGELHDKSLERRRTLTVTDDDFVRLADAARKITRSPRLYALICTLYDSGARPSEVYPVSDYKADYGRDGTKYRPIRWRDVFDDDGRIVPVSIVTSMKGRRIEQRLLVVTNRMADAFRELWTHLKAAKKILPEHAADLDNLIFPHRSYQSAFEVARLDAGLPNLRLRDLRRDWMTRLAKRGYSDRLAQRAAGHKRMQQSFEYTEFDYDAAIMAKAVLDESTVIEPDVEVLH